MPSPTREELEQMMQDNLRRMTELVDERFRALVDRNELSKNLEMIELERNYKIYNATNLPVLPKGTMILIDTRPVANASGVVAKYSSLGDRYVEEWAKQVNP
jgi:hypothetical protein